MADMNIADAIVRIQTDASELTAGLNKAKRTVSGAMGDIGGKMRSVGAGMTAMGAAIVGPLGMMAKSAADFDSGMREVNTMMGLAQGEFETMSQQVLKMSTDLGVDAVDSTKALYQAISAGVPRDNALAFLETATKAAIGGVTDTETAVDGLTTVLNAFGKDMDEVDHVADVMFETMKGGKTTIGELSEYMFQAAPIANAAGVSFEEVSAAAATLTAQGTPTAQAMTQIRAAITQLSAPTDAAKKVMSEIGIAIDETSLRQDGFAGTAQKLVTATGGSLEQLRKVLGSQEAAAAVLGVAGDNAGMMAAKMDAITNSAGAANRAYEEMQKSAARQWAQFVAQLNYLKVMIGDAVLPVFLDLAEGVKPYIEQISKWIEAHPQAAKQIGALVAVVGSLMLALGPVVIVFGQATIAMSSLTSAVGGLAAAFGIGPLSLVGIIGGFVAAGGIGYAIGKWLYSMSEGCEVLRAAFDGLGEGIFNVIRALTKLATFGMVDIGGSSPELGTKALAAGGYTQEKVNAMRTQNQQRVAGGGLMDSLPGVLPSVLRGANSGGEPAVNVNVAGNLSVREEADVEKLARELGRRVTQNKFARGLLGL